ncbi:hemerythrin domain-containing protein [Luedemannella helvata]
MTEDLDAVDLLLAQHEQMRTLFEEVSSAEGDTKRELFDDLVRLLAMHETAEEEVVHPMARRKLDDGDDIVDSRLAEEEDAKQVLSDLYDMGVDAPGFDEGLAELAQDVIAHAEAEEAEEFIMLREVLEPQQLQRMATAIRAVQAMAPTRPHPAAGESATANILAGPPLAVFDRMRDAIRDWTSSHP